MNEQETLADIIAEMRKKSCVYDGSSLKWAGTLLHNYANILEAAMKQEQERETTIHTDNSKVNITLLEENERLKKAMGNAQATREALKEIVAICDGKGEPLSRDKERMIIYNLAKSALAAPPRNCDTPLVVDGPADNNADKAWIVFRRHNPDAYFDVSGLLRCIDWLLAPAAKAEGGKGERTKPDA